MPHLSLLFGVLSLLVLINKAVMIVLVIVIDIMVILIVVV